MTTRREFTQPHLDSDHMLFGRGSCTGLSSRGRDLTEKTPKSRAPSCALEKSKKEIEGETKSFIIS